jgi:hypothetical protein
VTVRGVVADSNDLLSRLAAVRESTLPVAGPDQPRVGELKN